MKSKITILLIDDKEVELENIIETLKDGFPNWESTLDIVTYTDPKKAIENLNSKLLTPHIILLDIEMPSMNGFEFVDACGYNRLLNPDPYIIMISAEGERIHYYKEATNRRLEYLVKGLEVRELLVSKIIEYLNTWTITVNRGGRHIPIKLFKVLYFEADGDYSKLYILDNQRDGIPKPLKEIEEGEKILSKGFIRIHDSFIINIFHIHSYDPKVNSGRGGFVLSEEKIIPIGRAYIETSIEVKNLIKQVKGKSK